MNLPSATDRELVDAVFPLHGHAVLRDHAQALREALCVLWPWLETDAMAGIHPLRLVPGNEDLALLSQRTRLLLRVRAQRMDELAAPAGLDLNLQGHALQLGAPHQRALQTHSAMYAYRVASDSADELVFMAGVEHALAALGITAARVCGRHQRMGVQGRMLDMFSLMVHELAPQDALLLQQAGLGPHRLLGCGVFVPHKSAAAVR